MLVKLCSWEEPGYMLFLNRIGNFSSHVDLFLTAHDSTYTANSLFKLLSSNI